MRCQRSFSGWRVGGGKVGGGRESVGFSSAETRMIRARFSLKGARPSAAGKDIAHDRTADEFLQEQAILRLD